MSLSAPVVIVATTTASRMSLSHIYRALPSTIRAPPRTYYFSSSSSFATASSSSLAQRQLGMAAIKEFVDVSPLSISNAYPTTCTSANVIGSLDPHQKKIADHKIVVFSKSYCPFCSETKQYFASRYPQETVEVVECVRPPLSPPPPSNRPLFP